MNPNDNSAKSLIEILSLCEQTLAAFDTPNGTNDPHPIPAKALVSSRRRHGQSKRHFSLIRGGLSQPAGEANPR